MERRHRLCHFRTRHSDARDAGISKHVAFTHDCRMDLNAPNGRLDQCGLSRTHPDRSRTSRPYRAPAEHQVCSAGTGFSGPRAPPQGAPRSPHPTQCGYDEVTFSILHAPPVPTDEFLRLGAQPQTPAPAERTGSPDTRDSAAPPARGTPHALRIAASHPARMGLRRGPPQRSHRPGRTTDSRVPSSRCVFLSR